MYGSTRYVLPKSPLLADGKGGSVAARFSWDDSQVSQPRTLTIPDATGTVGLLERANTWTAAQRINASEALSLNTSATAGNGLLQLASGTTKANGIAFGTDTFVYRSGVGGIFISDSAAAGQFVFGLDNTNGHYFGAWTSHHLRLLANGSEKIRIKTTGQARFVPLSADPAGAETGDVYYNSTTNKLRVYNGAWVDLH